MTDTGATRAAIPALPGALPASSGRRALLALPVAAALTPPLAAPALATGTKRRIPAPRAAGGAIEAAVRIIRDSYVDPVPLRPMLEDGLAGLARLAPPAGKTGASALAEARPALAAARDDAEAVAVLSAAVRRLSGGDDVDPLSPALTAALRGMAGGLDPRSDYLPPDAPGVAPPAPSVGGIGLELAITGGGVTVVRPLPGGPAEGRLRPGDVLLALDGRPLTGLPLAEVVGRLRGPVGTEIGVTLRRGAAERVTLRIPRRPVNQPGPRHALLGRVAYLRPETFRESSLSDLRSAFATLSARAEGRLEGMLLDLRENGGGPLDVAARIAGDLLPDGAVVAGLAGRLAADNRVLRATGDKAPDLPLVAVVNDGTAAGAEIVAGALRDHRRAPLVGRRTAGGGTITTVLPLGPTGGVFRLTTARVTLPSGRGFEGGGLAPDLTVEAVPGSVAARLRASRDGANGARREPSPAPAWPELEAALARADAAPEDIRADPARPETDPEVRRAHGLLLALREQPSGTR